MTQSNQLVNFDTTNLNTTSTVNVTGLVAGDILSGIDLRPFNRLIYGVAAATSRIYSIDRLSGIASPISTISTALVGTNFGIDFNPTVDRLRVVSDQGQNLRINVDTGAALVDGALQYAAGDPNAGTPPQVVAAAYTNNVSTAVTTTLYTMDLSTQSLLTQAPPNAGTLNTVGQLGPILFPEAAFDISGDTGIAYAILNGFELSSINLATGAATTLGAINAPSSLIGLTVITAVPEPTSALLVAVGVAGCFGAKRFRRRKVELVNG